MPDPLKINLEREEVLKLLREIKRTPEMTQRELSSRVGISLGKVNFLLNALIRGGLVKVDNFKNSKNKKSYIYLLTPHGVEEKAKSIYLFIKRKKKEYERLIEEIDQLQKEVEGLNAQIASRDEKNA